MNKEELYDLIIRHDKWELNENEKLDLIIWYIWNMRNTEFLEEKIISIDEKINNLWNNIFNEFIKKIIEYCILWIIIFTLLKLFN